MADNTSGGYNIKIKSDDVSGVTTGFYMVKAYYGTDGGPFNEGVVVYFVRIISDLAPECIDSSAGSGS
jgi:hypothetical protein